MDQISVQHGDVVPEIQQCIVVRPQGGLKISEIIEWRLSEDSQTAQGDQ